MVRASQMESVCFTQQRHAQMHASLQTLYEIYETALTEIAPSHYSAQHSTERQLHPANRRLKSSLASQRPRKNDHRIFGLRPRERNYAFIEALNSIVFSDIALKRLTTHEKIFRAKYLGDVHGMTNVSLPRLRFFIHTVSSSSAFISCQTFFPQRPDPELVHPRTSSMSQRRHTYRLANPRNHERDPNKHHRASPDAHRSKFQTVLDRCYDERAVALLASKQHQS